MGKVQRLTGDKVGTLPEAAVVLSILPLMNPKRRAAGVLKDAVHAPIAQNGALQTVSAFVPGQLPHKGKSQVIADVITTGGPLPFVRTLCLFAAGVDVGAIVLKQMAPTVSRCKVQPICKPVLKMDI